jgi:maltose alpha-D-glucosyltransferase/alpha-amylase
VRASSRAHARGLRVITELVINHTSDQHPWFQRARPAKPGLGRARLSMSGPTRPALRRHAHHLSRYREIELDLGPVAGAYYWHRFYSHQPDLNFDNPRVLREVLGVMRFWLDRASTGCGSTPCPIWSSAKAPTTRTCRRRTRS